MVEWATLVVTVLGLGGLLLQIRSATQAQERDHQRQKNQATMDAYVASFEWRRTLWSQLPNDRLTDAVRAFCPAPDDDQHPHFEPVVTYLNYLENLAAGVHQHVYDMNVLDALVGERIVAAWHAYRPFIEGRRKVFGSTNLWIELEQLAMELEELHR